VLRRAGRGGASAAWTGASRYAALIACAADPLQHFTGLRTLLLGGNRLGLNLLDSVDPGAPQGVPLALSTLRCLELLSLDRSAYLREVPQVKEEGGCAALPAQHAEQGGVWSKVVQCTMYGVQRAENGWIWRPITASCYHHQPAGCDSLTPSGAAFCLRLSLLAGVPQPAQADEADAGGRLEHPSTWAIPGQPAGPVFDMSCFAACLRRTMSGCSSIGAP
jgi:hypothetical protein